jgi:hypothetical protein
MPQQPGVAGIMHWAAPVGGWNSLAAVAAMDPTDAVRMDNLFPDLSYLRVRRGYAPFCTVGASIKSLLTYSSAMTQKLLAAAGGYIYDVTSGTASSVASGFTSDVWQWTMMSTPGGQFLVAVNGTGKQWTYNGTAWTAATNTLGTGVTDSNQFAMVTLYSQRLFFAAEDNTLIYYLPVNVLQGQLSAFDAGAFLRRGGGIAALGNWTRDDATQGSQNLLVIVSTHGEVLVYHGIDPADATNWGLVGRFEIGEPVGGHRQLIRLGPDSMLICEDGFQALANYLALGESKALTSSISMKIGNAVTRAVKLQKPAFGWDAILYPTNNALLVNVPQGAGVFHQYTVNTISGAWCRFTGMNAQCWALFQDSIYFGDAGGTVHHADSANNDNGQPIAFDLVTCFQLPGGGATQKRALMCRPFVSANGVFRPFLDVNVDYIIANVTATVGGDVLGTVWDSFDWDEAPWSTGGVVQTQWYSVAGLGTAFAVHMTGAAVGLQIQLMAFDLSYEAGIGLL